MSDRLEKLKNRLYKKDESFFERQKRAKWKLFGKREKRPSTKWEYSYEQLEKRPILLPLKKIFVVAVVFLLLSLAALVIFLIQGPNSISSADIEIDVKSPLRVDGGEHITFDIFVENKNVLLARLGMNV